MAIRWIKNVLIDSKPSTIEIQLGDKFVGDKCYVRVNKETEKWFINKSDQKHDIEIQGVALLKQMLENRKVEYPDKKPFDWNP